MWIVPDKRVQNDACISSAEREEQITKAQPKGNVPALRFPEFTEEWEKCKLGDITINFNLRNKDRINYPMYSVTNNKGFVPQSEQFEDREMIGEDIKAYKIIHKNDFAYNPARINVGSIAKYNGDNPCMISSLYVCFKACDRVDADWLMQLLKTSKMNFYYNVNGEGGVRIYLFYPNFARISTYLPVIAEQKKIAKFLSLLDERIVTQNKIIEELETLIKGIVVTHYSATDHTIKVKIQDLGEAYSTMVMSKEQLTNDGNPCIFYGELFTLYGCVINEVKSRTSLEKAPSTLSHGRDLLFPASTTVDALSLIAPSALMQKGIILGGDMFGIKVAEVYNPIYLSYYFNFIANKRLSKYAKGTTIIHLHYNEIANIAIELPSIKEQGKVVSTIQGYSTKLSVERIILEKLSELKLYLLNQMFI